MRAEKSQLLYLHFRYKKQIYPFLFQMVYGVMGIARTGSVYMTMAITLERYFAIVNPLASFHCKKALGPLSLAFSIAWNIPRFFEWQVVLLNEHGNWTSESQSPLTSGGNWVQLGTWHEIHPSKLREGFEYSIYYRLWLTFIFIEAIPYLTIIALNAMILRKIVKSYTFRRTFTESRVYRKGGSGIAFDDHPMVMIPEYRTSKRSIQGLNGKRSLEQLS